MSPLPKITNNMWSILKDFKIICCNLGVSLNVGIFLSFYRIKILPLCGWITLHSLLGRNLLEPYADPYEVWEDRFVQL